jgi:hypothetical protein
VAGLKRDPVSTRKAVVNSTVVVSAEWAAMAGVLSEIGSQRHNSSTALAHILHPEYWNGSLIIGEKSEIAVETRHYFACLKQRSIVFF